MNDKFDELAKGLAQSVTRRGALKKFGVGLAGVVLASLGLASKAEAQGGNKKCMEWDCYGNYPYHCSNKTKPPIFCWRIIGEVPCGNCTHCC